MAPGATNEAWYKDRLRTIIEDAGGKYEDGWSLELKKRSHGTHVDKYWTPPAGDARLRSYAEVLRYLKLTEQPVKRKVNPPQKAKLPEAPADTPETNGKAKEKWTALSREAAIEEAKECLQSFQLPFQTAEGVKVNKLGKIVQSQKFWTDTHIFPVGFEAEYADPGRAFCFVSQIHGDERQGPKFTVSLRSDGAESKILAEEDSPYSVWAEVFQLKSEAQASVAAEEPQPPKTISTTEQDPTSNGFATTSASIHPENSADHNLVEECLPDQQPAKQEANSGLTKLSKQETEALAKGGIDKMNGLQLFGLRSTASLAAIEGLEGVSSLEGYKYVRERHNWPVHIRLLPKGATSSPARPATGGAKQSQQKGDKPKQTPAQKKTKQSKLDFSAAGGVDKANGGGDKAKPGVKRKRETNEDQESAKENQGVLAEASAPKGQEQKKKPRKSSVAVVMENLIKEVEKSTEKKARKSAAGRPPKNATSQAKGLGSLVSVFKRKDDGGSNPQKPTLPAGAPQPPQPQPRPQPIAQDERDFPGGSSLPPQPQPVPGSEHLPQSADVADLLAIWQVLGRFHSSLRLRSIPSLEDLGQSLALPADSADSPAVFDLSMAALAKKLTEEIVGSCLEVGSQVNEDAKGKDFSAARPLVNEETWVEAARRLFALASMGTQVLLPKHQPLSGGLDIALGDFVGSSPIAALGPSVVVPTILAGAIPESMHLVSASLPVGACESAAEYRLVKQDTLARIAVLKALRSEQPSQVDMDGTITACRNILRHLYKIKGPKDGDGQVSRLSAISFDGGKAAVAAKWPKPIDLHYIAIRNDLGYYAYLEGSIDAFAADIERVCDLFESASQSKKSSFSRVLQKARAPEIIKKVREALGPLVKAANDGSLSNPELQGSGISRTVSRQPSVEPGQEADKEAGGETESDDEPQDDLSEHLKLGEGCCVCWKDEDRGRILICDGCDQEYHIYCLHPPLPELPDDDEWFCGPCQASQMKRSPDPVYKQHERRVPTLCDDQFHLAAASLRGGAPDTLAALTKLQAGKLLVSLFEDSSTVRDMFREDETHKKELWTELRDLRGTIKRLNKELLEQQQQKPQGDDSRPRTRAEKESELELATSRSRVDEVTRQLGVEAGAVRLEPVGHDRHWNRYWVLGKWDADTPGVLFVEHAAASGLQAADGGAEISQGPASWGCYPDIASLDKLINYLNPRGRRENVLMVSVKRLREQIKVAQALQEKPDARDGTQNGEAGSKEDSEPAEKEVEESEPEKIIPGSEEDEELPSEPSAFDQLRDSIVSLQNSVEDKVTDADLARWNSYLEAATRPEELFAALLHVETLLPGERLKPWWQFWGFPFPFHTHQGSLAAVTVRLKALQTAMKRATGPSLRNHAAAQGGYEAAQGKYSFRTRRAAPGALAESNFDSVGVLEDEEIARQLQESYSRNLRRRSDRISAAPAVPESNGVRATRAAARIQPTVVVEDSSSGEEKADSGNEEAGFSAEKATDVLEGDVSDAGVAGEERNLSKKTTGKSHVDLAPIKGRSRLCKSSGATD